MNYFNVYSLTETLSMSLFMLESAISFKNQLHCCKVELTYLFIMLILLN